MLQVPKPTKPPKIKTLENKNWLKGVVTAFDNGRTPTDGLKSSNNTILEQDGTVRPRPSLQKWGPQPSGTILGQIYQFRSFSGTSFTNKLICMQKVAQDEVQTLSISGSPTGGTFTLTFDGQTTAAIDYNASASAVQTALEALSNISSGDVACTGGALPGTDVVITFGGDLANTDVELITSSDSLTGGTDPASSIVETTKGGDTGHIHHAEPEDTSWTEITGTEYSATDNAHFVQHDDKVIIMNGEDTLSYFDIDAETITSFTALSNPSAPTLDTNTGLSGSNFTVYYAVTADSTVGETTGTALEVSVSTDRNLWDPSSHSIKIAWTTVTGVKSWNVYCAVTADGDSNPVWGLLAAGIAADTLEFTDTGNGGHDGSTGPLNTFKSLPTANSTAGPKATRGEVINNMLWLTGDKNNPFYLWHDGGSGFHLDFTPSNGGGFVDVGSGGRELPVRVWNFRTGPGEPIIKVLTRGLSGGGRRYSISPQTITYGSSQVVVWTPTEDYGYSGTDSPDGLVVYENNTYYPSRDNFRSVGTKPRLQNLLSVDGIADTILNDLGLLNNDAMDKCVGVGFEDRIYWAVPVGTSNNNEIWVLDLQRGGAWMKPWSIACDWTTVVADNSGYSHHIILSDNTIYELSYSTKTNDDGTAFSTSGNTGLIYFSEDGQEWVRLIRLFIEVLRPVGMINFTVDGYTNSGEIETIGSGSIDETSTTDGFGWNQFQFPISPTANAALLYGTPTSPPSVTGAITKDLTIAINEDVRFFTVRWNTTDKNVDYSISRIVGQFVSIGYKNLL